MGEDLETIASGFRNDLKESEKLAREFTKLIIKSEDIEGDKGECIAHSVIAMRHLEDARMRYGKVIQYLNDGESIYDKK